MVRDGGLLAFKWESSSSRKTWLSVPLLLEKWIHNYVVVLGIKLNLRKINWKSSKLQKLKLPFLSTILKTFVFVNYVSVSLLRLLRKSNISTLQLLHVNGNFSYIKSKCLQRPKSIKKIVTSHLRHSTPSAKASTMRRPSSAFVELSGRPQKASFLLATKQQLNRRPCYEVAQLLLWCSRYYVEREWNTWPLRGL